MPKILVFDVMLNGRFVATERMPVTFDMIEDYDEMGRVIINMDKVLAKVLEKRPTLKNQPYNICF